MFCVHASVYSSETTVYCIIIVLYMSKPVRLPIGIGAGDNGNLPPQIEAAPKSKKYFSGKCRVKFRHFLLLARYVPNLAKRIMRSV